MGLKAKFILKLKEYKIVLAIVLPVLALVILRAAGPNRFRPDAPRWAEPSVEKSNLVSYDKFAGLPGEKLIITIDDSSQPAQNTQTLKIPLASILNVENIKKIRDHHGPVLLVSSETASAAKAWMILSQLGLKNIYILDMNNDTGTFKYKFNPESWPGAEL